MGDEAKHQRGIRYWMERVIDETGKVRGKPEPDAVHDLRVAIRRCRSIADGFRMMDPHPAWKKMRRAAKGLFSALGDLRDVQVETEWVHKLGMQADPALAKLVGYFQAREQELKAFVDTAISAFDQKQWLEWAAVLSEREAQLPVGSEVFQVIALERCIQAHALHSAALKTRSKSAIHALRIGIKKFRYIVENFLPDLHERWIRDLKHIQDLLGDIHDLDVLSDTARKIRPFESSGQRIKWQQAIATYRLSRIEKYRAKMVGKQSLWQEWRGELPSGEGLRHAILRKFEIWSALRDPDPLHTRNVLDLSLEIFDFLGSEGSLKTKALEGVSARDLLIVSVLGHEAGRLKSGKHHKAVVRVFEHLDVPPGWTASHLRIAGLIARYHTGALPNASQKRYAELTKSAREIVDRLAGILRFADALERQRDAAAPQVNIARNNGAIVITAAGVHERSRQAERIAAARHLLESACGVPIVVRPA